MHLFLAHFLEYLLSFSGDNVVEESEQFPKNKSSVLGCSPPRQ